MQSRISKRLTPEQQELELKKAELAGLENDLTQAELDLATLRARLVTFEGQYLRTVGALYAELDSIEAQIAQTVLHSRPRDAQARRDAESARAKASRSHSQTQAAQHSPERRAFRSSEDLKRLYREIAKRIHPDLATDEADIARRTRLMQRLNEAYEQEDEAGLRAILEEWEGGPESVRGEDTGAELIRVIRKIAQVRRRLDAIRVESAQLAGSELHQLLIRVECAREDGRDLLREMADRLRIQIEEARTRLQAMVGGRPQSA
jgi:ElaB/YqjD/DUF883 family membrane-anchored ribosome-binding protein